MSNKKEFNSISDTKSYLSSLIKVEIPRYYFKDYEIINLKEVYRLPKVFRDKTNNPDAGVEYNVKFLNAIPPIKEYWNKFLGNVEAVNIKHKLIFEHTLLFEILNIGKDIDIYLPFDEDTIKDSKILEITKEYGIDISPYYNAKTIDSNRPKLKDIINKDDFNNNQIVSGIIIKDFKKQIYELKKRYLLLNYINDNNTKSLYKILKGQISFHEKITKTWSSEKELIEIATDTFINIGSKHKYDVSLYSDEELGFKFKYQANSLIEACHLFLSQIATRKDNYIKTNIKICKNPECGRAFEGHGNKKYCELCDRRTVWSRRQRNKNNSK